MGTKIGILSLIAGLSLAVFSGIASLMESDSILVDQTFLRLLGEEKIEKIVLWSDTVWIQDVLEYVTCDLPFFMMFLAVGVILLVIGMVVKSH